MSAITCLRSSTGTPFCIHSLTGSSPASKSRSISRRLTGPAPATSGSRMRSSYSTSASISSTSPPRVIASAAVCTDSTLPSVKLAVHHHFGARFPVDRGEFRLDQFLLEAEHEDDFVDACRLQHLKMTFQQRRLAETQQALRLLLPFRLNQAQAHPGGKNNCAHVDPVVSALIDIRHARETTALPALFSEMQINDARHAEQ